MRGEEARQFLREATPGIRVVVRYRLGDGATDALGVIQSTSAIGCVVDTKRGPAAIDFADVIAARPVPPAPQRSPRPAQ